MPYPLATKKAFYKKISKDIYNLIKNLEKIENEMFCKTGLVMMDLGEVKTRLYTTCLKLEERIEGQ